MNSVSLSTVYSLCLSLKSNRRRINWKIRKSQSLIAYFRKILWGKNDCLSKAINIRNQNLHNLSMGKRGLTEKNDTIRKSNY